MKYFFLPLFLVCSLGLAAQTDVTVTVEAPGCGKPLSLYAFNGVNFDVLQAFAAGEAPGTFTTTFRAEEPVFHYVGTAVNDLLPVLLGGGETFTIRGSCGAFRRARVSDSELNAAYADLKGEFAQLNNRFGTVVRALAKATQEGDEAGIS